MTTEALTIERDRLLYQMREADARRDPEEGQRLLALLTPVTQALRDAAEKENA